MIYFVFLHPMDDIPCPQAVAHDYRLARVVVPGLLSVLQQYTLRLEMEARHAAAATTEAVGDAREPSPSSGGASTDRRTGDTSPTSSTPLGIPHGGAWASQDRATAPAWLRPSSGVASSSFSSSSSTASSSAAPSRSSETADRSHRPPSYPYPPSSAEWEEAALTAASCLVRLCKFPQASRALVEARAVPMLSRLLRLGPASMRQVALLVLYKLANPPFLGSTATAHTSGEFSAAASAVSSSLSPLKAGVSQAAAAVAGMATAPVAGVQGDVVLRQILLSGAVPDLCKALQALSNRPSLVTPTGGSQSSGDKFNQVNQFNHVHQSYIRVMSGDIDRIMTV